MMTDLARVLTFAVAALMVWIAPIGAASPQNTLLPSLTGEAADSATATETDTDTETETAAQKQRVEQLIGTLEDDTARAELIEQLRLLLDTGEVADPASEEAADPREVIDTVGIGVVGLLSAEIARTQDRFFDIFTSLADLPDFGTWLRTQLSRGEVRWAILRGVAELCLTLGAGILALYAVRRLTNGIWPHREGDDGRDLGEVVMRALGRMLLSLFSLAAFVAVANGTLIFFPDGTHVRQIAVGLILAVAMHRVVSFAVGELVRARYVRLSRADCREIGLWLRRVAAVMIYGYLLVVSVQRLGLPRELTGVMSNLFGLVVLVMVLRLLFTTGELASHGLSNATGPLSLLARILAPIWVIIASLYSVVLFLIWSLGVQQFSDFAMASLGSVAVITAALIIDAFLLRTKPINLPDEEEEGQTAQGEKPAQAHLVAHSAWERVRWPSRLIIAIVAILAVVQLWGLEVIRWVKGAQGQTLIGTLISVTLLFIIALVIWDMLHRGVESWLTSEHSDTTAKRTQRMRTVLPLVRAAVGFVLGTVVLLAVLAELGVNIAPLLAGAGVIGLAIGFGSQALVRDVISGAFILAENTLSVGDVVKLGSHAGLVEGLTIRSVRLRDLAGTVHTIPLGEITAVENMTKDYSYYLLDIGVSYSDDVDRVMEVVKQLGEELREDPEFGWNILEPLEVLGVDQFADSAVIIKARIKTVPLQQWTVGREFNRRMKNRFDQEGISIPFPQLTISRLNPQ